jgi:hypothetical protein
MNNTLAELLKKSECPFKHALIAYRLECRRSIENAKTMLQYLYNREYFSFDEKVNIQMSINFLDEVIQRWHVANEKVDAMKDIDDSINVLKAVDFVLDERKGYSIEEIHKADKPRLEL